MDLEFCNVSYSVRTRTKLVSTTTILNSVSGRFKSGQLSAIIGPSGSGKTSLLNVISGYRTNGVKGILKTNGKIRKESEFQKTSCYITQDDLLQPLLTLNEVMTVASNLKLPTSVSKEKKQNIVDEILADLGLTEQKHTRTEVLSGGQKKRLSIALELINNPQVLFFDEPTSGLDNVSTFHCIKLLHSISRQGKTVICTIHQPPASLFQIFDQVYVIARGMCIYQGATNLLVPFLSTTGFECPKHYNPADYIIELSDGENVSIVKTLSNAINNGKLNKHSITAYEPLITAKNGKVINTFIGKIRQKSPLQKLTGSKFDYPTTRWMQFYVLLSRMMTQIFRNRLGLQLQLLHCMMCGLSIGLMFYNIADDGAAFFSHLKFCVGVTLFFAYTQLMIPVLVYPQEVKLVKKEYFNRWYGLMPYYAALTISKLPTQIFFNMIFISLVYFMSGLPIEIGRFILFSTIGNIISFVAEGLGLAIGSIFNITNGSAVGPTLIAPFLGLAIYGFDFAKEVSWYMDVLTKMSFMRCGLVALVLTVFGLERKTLDCDDVYCHFQQPKVLLAYLDIDNTSIWSQVALMLALMFVFRTVGYLSLRWRFKR